MQNNSLKKENKKEKLIKKTYEYYNEISISYIIKNIINYSLYFLPIENIDIVELNINYKELIDKINDDYVLVEYNNINTISLLDYINSKEKTNKETNSKEINREIIKIIESYKLILENIEILLLNKLVHYDLLENNIVYNVNSNNFLLCNFKKTILINNIEKTNKYLKYYFKSLDAKIYPLEIYIIENILENNNDLDREIDREVDNKNINILNKDSENDKEIENKKLIFDINKIYNNYIKKYIKYISNLTIIGDNNYINNYKIECKKVLKKYLKVSHKDILFDLKQNYIYWDIFSINLLFLQIINIFITNNDTNINNTNINNTNINNSFEILILFSQLLIKNLSTDSEKRLSIRQIFNYIDNIFIYIGKKT
tara:strand:+ start:6538 stop:7650 length:1113 start_codon:yes stop_codon:yes gene_type:complete